MERPYKPRKHRSTFARIGSFFGRASMPHRVRRYRQRDPDMEEGLKKMMLFTVICAAGIIVTCVLVDRYREETGSVTFVNEVFYWDTYEESHTVYYSCGEDDICSYTYYTTEWEYVGEYTVVVNGKTFSLTRTWRSGVDHDGDMLSSPVPHYNIGDTVRVKYFDFWGCYSVISIDLVF